MNPKLDRTNVGDLVQWTNTKSYDYFNGEKCYGIILQKVEEFEYWIFARVLDITGRRQEVMIYKKDNPL